MNTGLIGLGKMGLNMVENLLDHRRKVAVFDLSPEAVAAAVEKGAVAAESPDTLAGMLQRPRIIWMMVPAGRPVDTVLELMIPRLEPGDVIIDGGNSRYTDSERRAKLLEQQGIFFLDAGTSGGLDGARYGACVMVGGAKEAYDLVEPLLRDMCVEKGYGYMGRSGSGHFVKMVHNGIEYGMMQAIGEGFDLLESSGYDLDPEVVAGVWANGSVIRGWLMELAEQAFSKDRKLGYLKGEIADSGEGRWTVEAALEQNVSIPVIAGALFRRYRSRSEENFSDKVVAALRHEFGGHGFKANQ
ncbi:phosphogluconate dehydrogenase (NAD(+)-dependent, decarboxylating) [Chlorobium phaeobacteroides]|uniref:6-phosphogluconate dehydrogenase (Decarboxylating) n=1 Tax=Chlorobium phaeobacteroides (strain DSM 266 / SMG 266 / 2430) TaxID=290317 RepID=A1BIC9_CHLPD|nr:decarboxylating 6-phosphogluconate dehydrogenase [Chlorobium phaeobacteroides]ABL66156.1 6-phosphogluconate dehydrogenase (decarboxylating) [Chlorobium phaeobacteroides DSM 266]MBV5327273.1 decarboxylating 6-phosphogluconate dehydrogenase [Chlorobium sp.]